MPLVSYVPAWNEFNSTMASAIICLATNQEFNLSKYIFDAMAKESLGCSGRCIQTGEIKLLMKPSGGLDDAESYTAKTGVTAAKINEITLSVLHNGSFDELTLDSNSYKESKSAKPKVCYYSAYNNTTTRPKLRRVSTGQKLVMNIQKLLCKEMKRVHSFVAMNSEAQEISGKKDESSSKKTEIAQDSSTKRAGDKLESDKSKKRNNRTLSIDKKLMKYPRENHLMIRMLRVIDREDYGYLWKLVKTKHGDTRPEDEHERLL
ncbi:hypothetical protein Tco_1457933 [Tanacetum coccineum]